MRKLKNPEKYVKVLKNRIAQIQKARDTWRASLGRYWFMYDDGTKFDISDLDITQARQCRIGDAVIIHAKVMEIKRNDDKYSVTFEIGEVRIVEE